jgi:hypothetical protein
MRSNKGHDQASIGIQRYPVKFQEGHSYKKKCDLH